VVRRDVLVGGAHLLTSKLLRGVRDELQSALAGLGRLQVNERLAFRRLEGVHLLLVFLGAHPVPLALCGARGALASRVSRGGEVCL